MSKLQNTFTTIGASNHSKRKRAESDFYSTDPSAITLLHKHGLLDNQPYWENAVGSGNLAKELTRLGYNVTKATDLYDRGYGESGINFLECTEKFNGNIITNPPYFALNDFILKGIELSTNRLYIFARIQTLESQGRYNNIYKYYKPIYVCPFVKRIQCYRDGRDKKYSSAIAYAWFIWDNTVANNDTKVIWLI